MMREEILLLLEQKRYTELRTYLENINQTDLAGLLGEFSEEEVIILFRILPKRLAAETFVYMDGEMQEYLIQVLTDRELKEVMDKLYFDDTSCQ